MASGEEQDPVFFVTPAAFRRWLSRNHEKRQELWVGFYKKSTGKKGITWPESVDQALCYGWIDGIRKTISPEAYKIRFTPRRPNSIWSAVNLRNFAKLKEQGLMTPAGEKAYGVWKQKPTNQYSYEQGALNLPPEFERKLKANKKAWKYFQTLPPSVRKPTVWYVMSAKQENTRLRRLEVLIQCSEQGLRIPLLRRPVAK